MRSHISRVVWSVWLFVLVAPSPALGQDRWQFGSIPSFSSGTYGTDTRTNVLETPFTMRRLFADGDVSVVLPFTCISGNGLVTVVNGTPVRSGGTAAAGRTARAGTRSTVIPGDTPVEGCGLGDIIARGRYYVFDERGWLPTIAVRGHFKAPTGDSERGLGTGEPDEGIGVELSRTIATGLTLMTDAGYTIIGEPQNVTYNNVWWYDIGIAKDVSPSVNLGVFYDEERTIVPGFENPRSILTVATIKGRSGWRFQAAGEFGLSDGAPTTGIALGASRRF